MTLFRVIVFYLAIIFITGLCQPAFAGSGGFRNETIDAGTIAMGNAFVGQANTPAAVYYNPAGLNQIDTATFTANDDLIAPRASFKNSMGVETKGLNYEYDIPAFFSVVPIIKDKLTLGMGSGSFWGLGTDWGQNSSLKYVATKSDLINTDSMLAAAYQVTSQWSVAAGVDNDYSKADENKEFINPFEGTHGNLALKADDDAWGYRLATLFKINDQNQVGLMYRSPIAHRYSGNLYLDGIGTVEKGIFFNGASTYETKVTEKLVLPQSVVLGYSFKPTAKWTINLDLEWMDWASVKQELLVFPNAAPGPAAYLSQGGNPLVHNWHSAWSEAIGTEYKITNRFRVRAGFYHHGTIGPQSYFDPAVPDLQAFGITEGFGYDITKNLTIDVGYSAQFSRTRKIDTVLGLGQANGKYSEFINTGAVSLTYKF